MAAQQNELKNKIVNGAYWMTGLNFGGQMITWLVTIIVIRFLKPEDYGLMAMATVLIGFLLLINEIGLGPAVIQKAEIDDEKLRQIFGCVIIINLVISCLIFVAAPLVALYFSEPRVVPIIRVLSLNFILLAFYFLPQALLGRNLEFRTKALINLGANLFGSATVLALAMKGHGVWSLVWGQLGINLFKAFAFNLLGRYRYRPRFSFQGIHEFIAFGGYVTISRILWSFYSQADVIIGGRVLGKELLGIYTIAMQLVSLPMVKVSPIISQIGFPVFSRIQKDMKAIQKGFLRIVKLINTISFPCFFGLAMIAPQAVPLILGAKWIDAVLPIQLLSIIMPLRFVGVLFGPVITGKGRPEVMLGNMIFASIVMPAAFLFGSRSGVLGLCYAWVCAYPLVFFIMLKRVLGVLELSLFTFFKEALFPMLSSIIMVLCLEGLKWFVPGTLAPMWLVLALVSLGITIYISAMLAFNKNLIRDFKAMLSAA